MLCVIFINKIYFLKFNSFLKENQLKKYPKDLKFMLSKKLRNLIKIEAQWLFFAKGTRDRSKDLNFL